MSDEKRIKDFEPATNLLIDDWFAVDSPSQGTRKMQASMFQEGLQTQITANTENIALQSGQISVLQQAVGNIGDKVDVLDAAITVEEYSATKLYAVDEDCVYEGVRYKCITAIESPEAFTPSHWQAISIEGELNELNSSLLDKCSIQYSDSANLTLTSGTSMQVLHHATLPAGKWLVHTMVRFASNGTGRRGLTVYRDSTHETSVGVLTNDFRSAVDGAPTCLKATYISEVTTGNNELYVCGYQNSGSSLVYTVRVVAIKLS